MLPNNPIILNSPQTQPQSETERIKKLVSKNTIKGLSIVQLICAGIAIITHITLLSNHRSLRSVNIAEAGAGLWTGFFFGVTGLIGLFTSQKPSKCKYEYSLAFIDKPIFSSTDRKCDCAKVKTWSKLKCYPMKTDNGFLFLNRPKVIYPKYSIHWISTVAHCAVKY